ncbi:MAG: formamidopyrimidine-DNA glycosylase [marine bacterium B5-7]|nr:MAG: formamidopyrimidine-DNA glycosylase [marine bacterium B5-7]
MPELPEVETTRRGIAPYLEGRRIKTVVVRDRRLRWPVPAGIETRLAGDHVESIDRRAKYLLMRTRRGCLMIHLGMSGSLRVLTVPVVPRPHDHVDLVMADGVIIRYHDPRRFGSFLWVEGDPLMHPLLKFLGPEPLSDEFDADHLFALSRRRSVAVKSFIMNARIVVGVGNIYASESLSLAAIHPLRAAGRISHRRYEMLVQAIRSVLNRSIEMGGTTLRDFVNPGGDPGYFEQTLRVYGRGGLPCLDCGRPVRQVVIGQRATFYCPGCQR